jgi:hypothetical protein
MIRLQCPGCRKNLGVKDELAGRLVACPQCKAKIRVPQPEPEVDELEEVEDEVAESITTSPRPGRRPPPPKTRPRDKEEDEEEPREAVRRSRRPRDDEEDEEEEERPRPMRKRKKKRRERRSASSGGMGGMLIALGVGATVCLLMIVVSFFVPLLALIPMLLGWLIAFAGGIWFLVVAFQDDAIQGILCLFVPFYSLIYLITHFEETKKPFLVQVVGGVLAMGGLCAGGFRGAKEAGGPYNRGVQIQTQWEWVQRPA